MSAAVYQPEGVRACPHCGLLQAIPSVAPEQRLACCRCHGALPRAGDAVRMRRRTLALALAALALYPLAVGLPLMRLNLFGHSHESGIVAGAVDLMTHGNVAIGLLVLVCSVLLPLTKLAGLVVLSGTAMLRPHRQAWMHRLIEWTGRWSMLDVLLVAVLVAAVKLGDMLEVSSGPGAVAFAACVVLSLAASASFNPHLLWNGRS